jgi:hypothetical protein
MDRLFPGFDHRAEPEDQRNEPDQEQDCRKQFEQLYLAALFCLGRVDPFLRITRQLPPALRTGRRAAAFAFTPTDHEAVPPLERFDNRLIAGITSASARVSKS